MPVDMLARSLASSLLLALASLGAQAQSPSGPTPAVPETRQIIEALKPARVRNLLVRPATPEPTVAAPAATASSVAVAPAPLVAPPAVPVPAPVLAPPAMAAPTVSATPVPAPVAAVPPPPARPPAPAPLQTAPPAAAIPPAVSQTTPAMAPDSPSVSLAIQFELNSALVRPESGAVLGNLVAAMLSPDLKTSRFVIEGHTDARGSAAANKKLSLERAEQVRLYLVALGVHPARLKAVGKGSSDLANPRDPRSPDNRRVRVVTIE